MRLIDADKLIEYCRNGLADMEEALKAEPPIKELNRYALAEMQTAMFIRDINEQSTVNEWIPVSGRLPDEGEQVLVTDGKYYGLSEWCTDIEDGNLVGWFDDWEAAVAWMPIEPYKENE